VSAAEGLETTLFGFLLVLSAAWFFEEREPGPFPRSALALAALALTRPDGVSLGVFLMGCAVVLRRPRPYLVRFAALFFGIVVIYVALRWLYYGDPLPNTLYAKGGGTLRSMRTGCEEFGRFAAASGRNGAELGHAINGDSGLLQRSSKRASGEQRRIVDNERILERPGPRADGSEAQRRTQDVERRGQEIERHQRLKNQQYQAGPTRPYNGVHEPHPLRHHAIEQ
jgi:hypothetical protein